MCSECAGRYEDGDEELDGRASSREPTSSRSVYEARTAPEWRDGAAASQSRSNSTHLAPVAENYEVFVTQDRILEVRAVPANRLVRPALTLSVEGESWGAEDMPQTQYYQTRRPSAGFRPHSACATSVLLFFGALAIVWAAAAGAWLIIR